MSTNEVNEKNTKSEQLIKSEEIDNSLIINKKNLITEKISEFFMGFTDSLKIFSIFNIISKNRKISNNIKNCLLLNGLLFIGSMILYIYLIEPVIEFFINKLSLFGYFLLIGKYFYYVFWLIPVYLVCNIITSLWIDEIYYESLEIIEGGKGVVEGQDFVTTISNQIERLLIVICFIVYVSILNYFSFIPGVSLIKYMTLSILNSLYVFEYILLQKYIRNYKSILFFIESKIFYFLGFGFTLTIVINIIDSVTINSTIFLMLFPFYLITSIIVNNERFNKSVITENKGGLKQINLKFLFIIEIFHNLGWRLINCLFHLFKLRAYKNKI
jgi:hypothetical protein